MLWVVRDVIIVDVREEAGKIILKKFKGKCLCNAERSE
jgi:bifunctional DNA-binding transcriptional regulator/antitoxin component of YhaV-PrlF toxin-antitoxin module